MSNSDEELKLSPDEKMSLAIQSGLQLLPCGIGGAISSIYFGVKQKKRFKRIERFYSEIAQELKDYKENTLREIMDRINLLTNQDKEAFGYILEELNDKVEREYTSHKINILKKYLKSTIEDPVNEENFDKRKYFLDVIGSLTLLECENLGFIYNQESFVNVENIKKEGVDKYEILGSINRLKSYGFLATYQFYYATDAEKGAEIGFGENIEISSLGRSFCEFCLTK